MYIARNTTPGSNKHIHKVLDGAGRACSKLHRPCTLGLNKLLVHGCMWLRVAPHAHPLSPPLCGHTMCCLPLDGVVPNRVLVLGGLISAGGLQGIELALHLGHLADDVA